MALVQLSLHLRAMALLGVLTLKLNLKLRPIFVLRGALRVIVSGKQPCSSGMGLLLVAAAQSINKATASKNAIGKYAKALRCQRMILFGREG